MATVRAGSGGAAFLAAAPAPALARPAGRGAGVARGCTSPGVGRVQSTTRAGRTGRAAAVLPGGGAAPAAGAGAGAGAAVESPRACATACSTSRRTSSRSGSDKAETSGRRPARGPCGRQFRAAIHRPQGRIRSRRGRATFVVWIRAMDAPPEPDRPDVPAAPSRVLLTLAGVFLLAGIALALY